MKWVANILWFFGIISIIRIFVRWFQGDYAGLIDSVMWMTIWFVAGFVVWRIWVLPRE
jgi:hypothetical protein